MSETSPDPDPMAQPPADPNAEGTEDDSTH